MGLDNPSAVVIRPESVGIGSLDQLRHITTVKLSCYYMYFDYEILSGWERHESTIVNSRFIGSPQLQCGLSSIQLTRTLTNFHQSSLHLHYKLFHHMIL